MKPMHLIKFTASLLLMLDLSFQIFAQETFTITSPISVKQYKLKNGLTVILNEDHSKPEVFGVVITKAGSKNDPADATGLAHYQEHMLFKGTTQIGTTDWAKEKPYIDKTFALYDSLGKTKDEAKRKDIQQQINDQSLKAGEYQIPNEFDKILKSFGGTNMNANTSSDRTIYFNSFPSNQIEKWLDLYSHRFEEPIFRLFQAELEVIYEEKNLYNDMFQTALIETFLKNFYKKHPYGTQTTIGTTEHLKNPSLTKMYQFFKTYYVANNMALVLSGDFNSNEIMPIIEAKFGKLQSGDIPKFPEYKEDAFKGRELVTAKLSPIKIGILGYRMPAAGNLDEMALKICNSILSNQSQTGLLDKLSIDNKILAGMVIPMPMKDAGVSMVLFIPKMVGQSLDKAEALITAEIEKLSKGEFDDAMLEAIKNQQYREFVTELETNQNRALILTEAFGKEENISEYLKFPEKIKAVTKDDIIRVAKKYYGKDYLAFHSNMGFPKKMKLEKPGYKPVVPKQDAISSYSKKIDAMKSPDPKEQYFDFNKAVTCGELTKGVTLYTTINPLNDIYSLKIKFGYGSYKDAKLTYATQLMNYAGTKKRSVNELKNEFAKQGATYSISCDDSYVIIEMDGIENKLEENVKLLNELLTEPVIDKDKLKIIIQGAMSERKMERAEPDNIAKALVEYLKFGNNSSYLRRLSMKEINSLNTDSMVVNFKKAISYEAVIHFVGKTNSNGVQQILKNNISFSTTPNKSESPVVVDGETYKENTVYFVNRKDALQSKVRIYINGNAYDKTREPFIDAFNQYFSGDFSGLVLQEIREYRSLAYGAGARYTIPKLVGKKSAFGGMVNTQADKTIEALDVFSSLINNMPEKKDRIETVKPFLILSVLSDRPYFRDLSESIESWKLKGYTADPAKYKMEIYKKLTFDDITKFYKENIKGQPVTIAIVGDKKRVNMKNLEKFGKIIYIKEKSLFK